MSSATGPTIFALSSGRPPAAIAVIRISGPRAGAALEALGVKVPPPRQAKLARVRDPRSGEIIDEALVLWFPAPNSETGEDVAELQGHGGPAVIAGILDALANIDGLRMAEPGEFTRRGFENGKLDLTAVEGLADLVAAETEGQRRQAFRQMKGLLGGRAEAWRERLIRALALVEARIDFSDEADVPEDLTGPALAIVEALRDEIAAALADGGRGERLREGLVVAIAGPPNAGKSTLLNRVAKREAAIVSPHAGTTRDVIEVHLDLGGYPVTLLDTAGIRETSDPVEMEGVRRARDRAAAADLVLWVSDASEGEPVMAEGLDAGSGVPVWQVVNKADLLRSIKPEAVGDVAASPADWTAGLRSEPEFGDVGTSAGSGERNRTINGISTNELGIAATMRVDYGDKSIRSTNEPLSHLYAGCRFIISASTGDGIAQLVSGIGTFVQGSLTGAEQALVTRARHRAILVAVQHLLTEALTRFGGAGGQEELLAEQLRRAATELGRLTGRVDVEDILDVIFRDFCIGK